MSTGERIRELRERRNLTLQQLAERIGVSHQSVQSWETGKSAPKNKRLQQIAQALGTTREYLIGFSDYPELIEVDEPGARVPVISWVKAGNMEQIVDIYEPGVAEEFTFTHARVKRHTFALRVEGDSMSPVLNPGMIVVVEPDMQPTPGHYVVARYQGMATLKQLSSDGIDWYLKPANPEYPTRRVTEDIEIIGVVVEATQKFA